MNHPLHRFHRPRHGTGLREAASGRKARSHLPAKWLDAKPRVILEAVAAPRMPRRAPPPPAPPPFAPAKPAEKRRWRWYQYSLRSLLLLMLLVSLLMSWYRVKWKRAIAQKNAVAAILAAGGTAQYDCEFDTNGEWVKGAKGRGPEWLRKLIGLDYFDKVVVVSVNSKEGAEALSGLANLKSIDVISPVDQLGMDDDECLKRLPAIDGVDELIYRGYITESALGNVARLRHLKRLILRYYDGDRATPLSDERDFSVLRSCAELRELTIVDYPDLSAKTMQGLGGLSQLERLSISGNGAQQRDIRSLGSLPMLRELAVGVNSGLEPAVFAFLSMFRGRHSTIAIKHVEGLSGFPRLEKLDLNGTDIHSPDLQFVEALSALRELDLSNCPDIDDAAAIYLKKMKGLKRLNLEGTNITNDIAESIDDALPDCEVRY